VRSREIARRYAEALYLLVHEQGNMDQVEAEYRRVLADVAEVPEFGLFLAQPLIARERKVRVFDQAFPELFGYLRNLVHLLIRNRREDYLGLIYEEFRVLQAEAEGIIRVQVASARAFSSEERDRLTDRLMQTLGRRVTLEERLDPELLGGVRLEVDGKVIDGTLRARLEELRALLEG
jgi:F-type H+-transporting ATPase subunit delta